MENQFPGNSRTDKEKSPAKAAPAKKVDKIVTGTVTTRKKPLSKKFKEFVVGDDSKSVLSYVWQDILIPSARDMVFDAFTSGVERKMYGEVRSRRGRGNPMQQMFGNATYNAYNRYSASSSSLRPDPRQAQAAPNRRGRAQVKDLAELIFDSRGDATEVLDAMIAIADQYQAVTISDLWDLLGRTGEPTDENFGWADLVGTDIYKVPEGYLLDLPRPHALD
jgi:hypothetical protein